MISTYCLTWNKSAYKTASKGKYAKTKMDEKLENLLFLFSAVRFIEIVAWKLLLILRIEPSCLGKSPKNINTCDINNFSKVAGKSFATQHIFSKDLAKISSKCLWLFRIPKAPIF